MDIPAKHTVSLELSTDLVERARRLTPDLSETVDRLLERFLRIREPPTEQQQRDADEYVRASNAFVEKHGTLAQEFPPDWL